MPYKPRTKRKPYTAGKKPDKVLATPCGVYLPNEESLVKMLACKGATDSEIEEICLLVPGTLAKWRKIYPSLEKSLEEGRSKPDAEVLYAMYRTAVGFKYSEQVAVGGREPEVLTIERQALPSFPAQKHWMGQRQKALWREVSEHSGPGGSPIGVKVEDRNSIIDSILSLIAPKPDPEPKKRSHE